MKTFYNAALLAADHDFISLTKQRDFLEALPSSAKKERSGLAGRDLMKLLHCPCYVDGVFEGTRPTGFHRPASPAVLKHIQASVAAEVAAVAHVLRNGGVACAPVSGFHHAQFDRGAGYCTFNGLLLAVRMARLMGLRANRVLIIDGDAHYGNGTDELVLKHLSMLGVTNLTHDSPLLQQRLTRENWYGHISEWLSMGWDLVLYQAGADAHKDDPYDSGYLSNDEWFARDALVFKACRSRGIPCVWNLAGGYNPKDTVGLHLNTWETAQRVYRPVFEHA